MVGLPGALLFVQMIFTLFSSFGIPLASVQYVTFSLDASQFGFSCIEKSQETIF